jgi:hypothetical protein
MDPERGSEWLAWVVSLLQDGDEATAVAAADLLGKLGAEGRPALPELLRWPAQFGSLAVCRAVTRAVRRLDPGSAPEGYLVHPLTSWGG